MQTNLEGILATEALVAVATGKRFDSEMNPLVSLEIVIAIEGLLALIALEGSVIHGLLMSVLHRLLPISSLTHLWREVRVHRTDERHLRAGSVKIRHDGRVSSERRQRIGKWPRRIRKRLWDVAERRLTGLNVSAMTLRRGLSRRWLHVRGETGLLRSRRRRVVCRCWRRSSTILLLHLRRRLTQRRHGEIRHAVRIVRTTGHGDVRGEGREVAIIWRRRKSIRIRGRDGAPLTMSVLVIRRRRAQRTADEALMRRSKRRTGHGHRRAVVVASGTLRCRRPNVHGLVCRANVDGRTPGGAGAVHARGARAHQEVARRERGRCQEVAHGGRI